MKTNLLITRLLLVLTLTQSLVYAQGFKVENQTLQEVLKSMAPKLHNSALSATFVRTIYIPQSPKSFSENKSPKVERTTISELLVNSDGVTESVCDARTTGLLVKQYAFHYSNNGICAKVYDSRNNRGIVRKSPKAVSNYLSLALSPYTGTCQSRFISRAMPTFLSRLKEAQITSETSSVIGGTNCITLEGKYKNSDPEQYFKMTVIPAFNYAVAELEEHDKNRRILTEISAIDFVEASDLWLPKQTAVRKYRYDDHEGNTVQIATLDILEPKAIPVGKNTFSIKFPSDAKLHDATSGIDLGKIYKEIDEVILASIDDIDIPEMPVDKKGNIIIARTKQAYKRESSSESIEQKKPVKEKNIGKAPASPTHSRILQMPESKLKQLAFKTLWVVFAITVAAVVLHIIRKKSKLRNNC